MRGAALKLGQMISLQEKFIPKEVAEVLSKLRDSAYTMPWQQIHAVLKSDLGENWRDNFSGFEQEPFAAASIGQVHRGVLTNGDKVAVKIKYPGVAESIESDLKNLKLFAVNLFPKGLYIEKILEEAKIELSREVDFVKESKNSEKMKMLLKDVKGVYVPKIYPDLVSKSVLTAGVPLDDCTHLPQPEKNALATKLLDVTLRELFQFRFMQTDPNWSNFLYHAPSRTLNLIDFGAARPYAKRFTDRYIQMVYACAARADDRVLQHSKALGFTTGYEAAPLERLHLKSAHALGEPFSSATAYDFARSDLTARIVAYGREMLGDRLTPPPSEAYTLHRKLSGFFLSCVKLGAVVPCREMFLERYKAYDWEGVERDDYTGRRTF